MTNQQDPQHNGPPDDHISKINPGSTGEEMRIWREEIRRSQQELADDMGVPLEFIQRIEREGTPPFELSYPASPEEKARVATDALTWIERARRRGNNEREGP